MRIVFKSKYSYISVGNNGKLVENEYYQIFYDGNCFIVSTQYDDYKFKKLVLATGGKNFKLPMRLGHKIITPTFTLAPLEIAETQYYNLSGLSLKDVWIKVFFDSKKLLNVSGDLLFTRNSISGPVVFKISSFLILSASLFAFVKILFASISAPFILDSAVFFLIVIPTGINTAPEIRRVITIAISINNAPLSIKFSMFRLYILLI